MADTPWDHLQRQKSGTGLMSRDRAPPEMSGRHGLFRAVARSRRGGLLSTSHTLHLCSSAALGPIKWIMQLRFPLGGRSPRIHVLELELEPLLAQICQLQQGGWKHWCTYQWILICHSAPCQLK